MSADKMRANYKKGFRAAGPLALGDLFFPKGFVDYVRKKTKKGDEEQ